MNTKEIFTVSGADVLSTIDSLISRDYGDTYVGHKRFFEDLNAQNIGLQIIFTFGGTEVRLRPFADAISDIVLSMFSSVTAWSSVPELVQAFGLSLDFNCSNEMVESAEIYAIMYTKAGGTTDMTSTFKSLTAVTIEYAKHPIFD